MQAIVSNQNLSHMGEKKNRFALFFLIVTLISGLLIVFLTPPMCTPDENAHFMNAYAVSHGDFFPTVVENTPGRYVESRVLSFINKYMKKFYGNLTEKYSYSDQYFDGYLEDNNTEMVWYGSNLNTINPFSYLPAGLFMAVGNALGRLFSFSSSSLPYNLLLFGRIGNLLFYSFVTYFALKRTPCFNKTIIVLAMMPISLFLGASVNYDALLIPVSFLLVSEICKLLMEPSDKKLTKGDLLVVLICTFFLVGIKQVYAILLILLLAVPKKKYGSTKKMIICIVSVVLTGLIAYTPVMIMNHISRNIISETTPYILEQTEYVKTHLGEMPHLFFHTVSLYKGFYLSSFWGSLGQLDTNIPLPFGIAFYFILLIVSISEIISTKLWKEQWKRVLPFVAVTIGIIGIFGAMYITWTPLPGIAEGVGSSYISGVQGRYLIQLFVPMLLIFCFGKYSKSKLASLFSRVTDHISYTWITISAIITPLIIFVRYW